MAHAGLTVLALVAWSVAADQWWLQPVTTLTWWWTLPGLVLAVATLLLGFRTAALWFAVPALVWLWCWGTLFLPGSPPDATADLRVATWNTAGAPGTADEAVALATRTDADVLVLQEVTPTGREGLVTALADQLPHRVAVDHPRLGTVLVLSRHPVADEREVRTPAGRTVVVARLDVGGRPVQLVPLHLTTACRRCGTSFTERLRVDGATSHVELARVLQAIDRRVPVVVGGDLNSTERSQPYRTLTGAGFADPHRAVGTGPGFTWPADRWFPAVRVDWILTRGLAPVGAWVDRAEGSDHRPVVVDLLLPQEPQ